MQILAPHQPRSARGWCQKCCLSRGDLLNDLHPLIIRQAWQGCWFRSLTLAEWHQLRFLWRKTSALIHLFLWLSFQHGQHHNYFSRRNGLNILPRVPFRNLRRYFCCLKSCFASAGILIPCSEQRLTYKNKNAALEDTNHVGSVNVGCLEWFYSQVNGVSLLLTQASSFCKIQAVKWTRCSSVCSSDYLVLIRKRWCTGEIYLYKTILTEHLQHGLSCWLLFIGHLEEEAALWLQEEEFGNSSCVSQCWLCTINSLTEVKLTTV